MKLNSRSVITGANAAIAMATIPTSHWKTPSAAAVSSTAGTSIPAAMGLARMSAATACAHFAAQDRIDVIGRAMNAIGENPTRQINAKFRNASISDSSSDASAVIVVIAATKHS